MRGDSGQLPVDFLVGFTIFILSLIMVANFVPSLLVGLQRTTGIDYNAVAYRTGVVLVEDPGQPSRWDNNPLLSKDIGAPMPPSPILPSWEQQTKDQKIYPSRFGLALTRDAPNILSINKIERFFNSSFSDPVNYFYDDTDYRNKLLFSSYRYGYNVTLQNISPMKPGEPRLTKMLGEPYPAGYGYIRRYVVIKQNTNVTIDMAIHPEFNATSEDRINLFYRKDTGATETESHQEFVIRLNNSVLYNGSIDASMKIDLQKEPLSIRITGLRSFLNNTAFNPSPIANSSGQWATNDPVTYPTELIAPTNVTLVAVTFYDPEIGVAWPHTLFNVNLTVDRDEPGGWGQVDWVPTLGNIPVMNTIELYVDGIYPETFNSQRAMDIVFTFQNRLPHTLIAGTYLYDYNPANVTQPVLSTGMLEVGIW